MTANYGVKTAVAEGIAAIMINEISGNVLFIKYFQRRRDPSTGAPQAREMYFYYSDSSYTEFIGTSTTEPTRYMTDHNPKKDVPEK